MTPLKQIIIDIVNEVPEGYVVSFGAIAKQILHRTKKMVTGQLVGRQLSGMPQSERVMLPRWRVINKQGYVSSLKLGTKGLHQISLLEKEGYEVVSGYVREPMWREFEA